MKRIEDIEKLNLNDLESISENNGIVVPNNLKDHISAAIAAREIEREERSGRRKIYAFAGAFTTVAAGLALTLTVVRSNQPKDTFDDPALAYAELEKTFAYISSKVGKGEKMVEDIQPIIEKTSEKLNKVR